MLDFMMEFIKGISDAMFTPLLIATAVGLVALIQSFDARSRSLFSSAENTDARWRIMAITQGLIIGWVVYLLMAGFPDPNYIIQKETIVKKVSVYDSYSEVRRKCINKVMNAGGNAKKAEPRCHNLALISSRPDIKIVNRTAPPKIKIKTKIAKDPYRVLYNNCVDSVTIYTSDGMSVYDLNEAFRLRSDQCHYRVMDRLETP